MLRLTLRKIVQGILMLLIVSAATFALLSGAGGDALAGIRDNPQVSAETIARLESAYGLDRSFVERYGSWLAGAVRGDLGESISFRIPVAGMVVSRFLNTAMLAVVALVLASIVSFALAIASARYRSRVLSGTIEVIVLITASTPRMVLALLALVLALMLSTTAPVGGGMSGFQFVAASVVLAIPLVSIFLAQLRDGLREAMNEDFVKVARSLGFSEWTVITRHALRAAINPFLTLFGLSLGALLGGSVIVETVLGWPGIGALTVAAVRARDVPLVMGVVLISSLAVWAGNTAAEFLQLVNDPRIRSGDFE